MPAGSRPWDGGGGGKGGRRGSPKNIFRPFGPQFGPKIKKGGGTEPPGPSPGSSPGLVCTVRIQYNPGNSYSEEKRKTVRVKLELARVRVDEVNCKIQFAVLKINSYWFFSTSVYSAEQIIISSEPVTWLGNFYDKHDLFLAPNKIKLM